MTTLEELLELQCGVVSRSQAQAAGLAPHDIRRLLRRREWARVHAGVFVVHTGPLTWLQRAWAAVLATAPSALSHDSALRAVDGPGRRSRSREDPIQVAVDRHRVVVPPPGVVVHATAVFPDAVQWNASPPRLRVEEALLDLAAEASSELGAVGVLADAVQARITTADRLEAALAGRRRIRRRRLLTALISDVAEGSCSALEQAYRARVVRPHGLPVGRSQVSTGAMVRDVELPAWALVVELDGRLFHAGPAAWDADHERDLDVAVEREGLTIRLSWGQVLGRGCATARKLGRVLSRRGWPGRLHPCPRCTEDAAAPERRQRRGSGSPSGTEPRRSA